MYKFLSALFTIKHKIPAIWQNSGYRNVKLFISISYYSLLTIRANGNNIYGHFQLLFQE